MTNVEDILVYNFIKDIPEEYRINYQQQITKENKKISFNENEGKIVINVKITEHLILIFFVKILDYNSKEVKLSNFEITLMEISEKDSNIKQKININIPIKRDNVLSQKMYSSLNLYFSDFIQINKVIENNYYLVVYLFSQLHIFSIYEKDDKLKYNKIIMKKFENGNSKFKVMYLGSKKSEDNFEIGLLLKPENKFLFLTIDINDKNKKVEEKEYIIDLTKYANILNSYKRSNCGKFIFLEKETNKKYILYKDNENQQMIAKEIEINHLWNNPKEIKFYYLYNIDDIIYILADISEIGETKNNEIDIIFGIYKVEYNKNMDIFKIILIQKIKIMNIKKDQNMFVTMNIDNCIFIKLEEELLFINLNEKSLVYSFNKVITNSKNLNISRIFADKYKNNIALLLIIEDKIYLSKFSVKFCKSGKCIVNNDKNEKKEDNKNIIKNSQNLEQKNKNILKPQKDEEIINDEKIKKSIKKIINDRINKNQKKFESLRKENEEKYNMIMKDIESQNQIYKGLEKKLDELIKVLNKIKERNEQEDEEEEEENDKINYKNNYHKKNNRKNKDNYNSNSNKNNYFNNQLNQNINPKNIINNPQNLFCGQINPQSMINRYNLGNNSQNMQNNNNLNPIILQQLIRQQIYQQQMQMMNK